MLQNPFLGFIFALANRKRGCQRCGSSAWLEYMPVTHGVAGSSPVRTARALGEIRVLFFCVFCYINPKRTLGPYAQTNFLFGICFPVFRLQWNSIAPSKQKNICSKIEVIIIITS